MASHHTQNKISLHDLQSLHSVSLATCLLASVAVPNPLSSQAFVVASLSAQVVLPPVLCIACSFTF